MILSSYLDLDVTKSKQQNLLNLSLNLLILLNKNLVSGKSRIVTKSMVTISRIHCTWFFCWKVCKEAQLLNALWLNVLFQLDMPIARSLLLDYKTHDFRSIFHFEADLLQGSKIWDAPFYKGYVWTNFPLIFTIFFQKNWGAPPFQQACEVVFFLVN